MLERMTAFLRATLPGKRVRVTASKYVRRRTLEQNSYLWGVVYPTMLREGGEQLRGWTAEDLHRLMLMKHFGSELLTLSDARMARPVRTSSKLSTAEFSDFVGAIQQFCAELGIYIPDPNEPDRESA
jgi:hypothetical protein